MFSFVPFLELNSPKMDVPSMGIVIYFLHQWRIFIIYSVLRQRIFVYSPGQETQLRHDMLVHRLIMLCHAWPKEQNNRIQEVMYDVRSQNGVKHPSEVEQRYVTRQNDSYVNSQVKNVLEQHDHCVRMLTLLTTYYSTPSKRIS